MGRKTIPTGASIARRKLPNTTTRAIRSANGSRFQRKRADNFGGTLAALKRRNFASCAINDRAAVLLCFSLISHGTRVVNETGG